MAFLKQHRQAQKFAAELRAYQESVTVLGTSAPRLIGVYERDGSALLLSALPGGVAADVDWSADAEYALHVRAARLLRLLHDLPVQASQRLTLETRTRDSLARWTHRAKAHFSSDVIDWTVEQVEAGIAQAPPICICHRDFSPRNWIATRDGQLGLIDFERTCVDFQCMDWSRLWMREWLQRPSLKDAFFEGYGEVTDAWEASMQRLLVLNGVGGVVWATEHNDPAFAEESRLLVQRLRSSAAR